MITPTLVEAVPDIATYRRLRHEAGMTDRPPCAAAAGLAGSLYSVIAFVDERAVGMARVIGDGGCFFQICDVAVVARRQGCGIGHALMTRLTNWLDENVCESAFVSLMADGESHRLYTRHGFEFSAPKAQGMVYPRRFRRRQ
ncbi:MAG: GNAT family N-acetyltransferase [Xanthomonadales bacterium]|nr:GNAT family N-acetyltransferase [Xanthomonadales bacterium]|tara:strand:- start:1226 stop:1651 length:426 start_codon:yes stop_codon:yes gene_type:complete